MFDQLRSGVAYLIDPERYTPTYTFADHPCVDASTAPTGEFWFPSFNARNARQIGNGGADAVAEPAVGTLYLPDGASSTSPVPAVVILHGSAGDYTGRSGNLARKLAAVGIAGFTVDTFAARGLGADENYFARLTKASIYTQIADAYGALTMLQEHPAIRGDRVGVVGFSLGGASALLTQFEQVSVPMLGTDGPRFAAHVGFYAGGNIDFEDFRTAGAPAMLTFGSEDESIDPDGIREFADRLRRIGVTVEVHEYPGAAHGWDEAADLTFYKRQVHQRGCITYWRADGSVVEGRSGASYDKPFALVRAFRKYGGTGFSVGRHDAANRRSVADMITFLDRNWGGGFAHRIDDSVLSLGIPTTPMRTGIVGKGGQ